jgi:hypothetical protein
MGQLLPVIKNYEWFKDDALMLKESLLDFDESPVIGIGEDLDTKIQYTEATSAEAYESEMAAKKKEALENLKKLEITYEVQELNGAKVVVASGQEFASEKILDPDFLKKVHTELDSEQIAIGIPFQGLLVAISNKDTDLLNKFPMVIKRHYENPQADKISDRIFLSVNAVIIAHAGVEQDAPHAAGIEPCFVQTMTLTGATERDMEYVVFIGHKELGELHSGFEKTFRELMTKCKEAEATTAVIKFMIVPDIITKTEALENLCKELLPNFCNTKSISNLAPSLNSLQVVFHYDDTVIAEDICRSF